MAWTYQASGRNVTGRLWGNVHVHESRREPDMLGCGPLSLKRYGVEVKKDGKIKCCALKLASWHCHCYRVTQSTLGCVIKHEPDYVHIVTGPLLNTWSGVFPISQEHDNGLVDGFLHTS